MPISSKIYFYLILVFWELLISEGGKEAIDAAGSEEGAIVVDDEDVIGGLADIHL